MGPAPRPAGEAAEGVAARVERQARAMVVVEGAEALVTRDAQPQALGHSLDGERPQLFYFVSFHKSWIMNFIEL